MTLAIIWAPVLLHGHFTGGFLGLRVQGMKEAASLAGGARCLAIRMPGPQPRRRERAPHLQDALILLGFLRGVQGGYVTQGSLLLPLRTL